ncbi:MAG TPA: TolC family protein, partial [Isosphaeraceae bacterium]|nr:TolC family protein [Isosphaeraceae bacterium]
THKREARSAVSKQAKRVLEARYQDAVRIAIDNLGTRFVDALEARESGRFAEENRKKLDEMLAEARQRAQSDPNQKEPAMSDHDGLVLERRVAGMLVNAEQGKLRKVKRQICEMLAFPIEAADSLELRGSLRDYAPALPPDGELVSLALCQRPDLVAQRMEIHRSLRDVDLAMANRFADAYLVYSPWSYRDNSGVSEKSISSWGAGAFITIPLYNRNQGNVRRARITVLQARSELVVAERRAQVEVLNAVEEYRASKRELDEIEREILPAIRRRRDDAQKRYHSAEIDADKYLSNRRDFNSIVRHYRDTLVRHRRSMLEVNFAVGQRILP